MEYGILAQLVEHLTFNQVVRGSNPRCLIRKYYRNDSAFFVLGKKLKQRCTVVLKRTTSAYIYITYVVVGSAQSRCCLWRIAGGSL